MSRSNLTIKASKTAIPDNERVDIIIRNEKYETFILEKKWRRIEGSDIENIKFLDEKVISAPKDMKAKLYWSDLDSFFYILRYINLSEFPQGEDIDGSNGYYFEIDVRSGYNHLNFRWKSDYEESDYKKFLSRAFSNLMSLSSDRFLEQYEDTKPARNIDFKKTNKEPSDYDIRMFGRYLTNRKLLESLKMNQEGKDRYVDIVDEFVMKMGKVLEADTNE